MTDVEAALATVEEDAKIEDAVKELLRSKYPKAIAALKEVASHSEEAAEFREDLTRAPTMTTELRNQLQELPSADSFKTVTASGSLDDVQEALITSRGELAARSEQLATVTAELSEGERRPADISVRIPDAQRELSEVRQQIASQESSNDDPLAGRVADRIVLQAQQTKLLAELEKLKQEQLSMSARRMLQQTRKELLSRQVENASAAVAAYETSINSSVTKQARDITDVAAKVMSELPEAHPTPELAAEVQQRAQELANILRDKAAIAAATARSSAKRQRLVQQYEGISKQLELGQPDHEMAEYLLKLRDLLDNRSSDSAKKTVAHSFTDAACRSSCRCSH